MNKGAIIMKKLYVAILLITVTLFISCDEKKAKDEIKKALDKTIEEKDKATPKLTKPAFSQPSANWDTPITFPKVAEHTYRLKEKKTGVALSEATGNKMAVTATQSAQNVIIVATLDGRTIESNSIEFTRIPGNALSFQYNSLATSRGITTSAQTATKSGGVAGDTRNIQYSVSPTGQGITIDSSSGAVTLTSSATEGDYTITAELPQTAKYERVTASYTLVVR